ncbi:hypothetical protein V6Z12_A05G320200 [Gossypium hirsutum]
MIIFKKIQNPLLDSPSARDSPLLLDAAHESHRCFCASTSDAEPRGKAKYVLGVDSDVEVEWCTVRRVA